MAVAEGFLEGQEAVAIAGGGKFDRAFFPLVAFEIGGQALIEPGGEAATDETMSVLVPAFVSEDGEIGAAINVVGDGGAVEIVGAGFDGEVDGGVDAGPMAGEVFPLSAGVEEVDGKFDGDAGGLADGLGIAAEGGLHEHGDLAEDEGIAEGGVDEVVGGFDSEAIENRFDIL